MAIEFARVEYVSRSSGGNACRVGAYNARDKVACEVTGKVFDYSRKSDSEYHGVALPEGASSKFKNISVLWNMAERAEKRKDSQISKHEVLALPDNKDISKELRVDMVQRYVEQEYTSKGIAVQVDIHNGHGKAANNNRHAHLQIATRRFDETGENFNVKKARDLDPVVRGGMVVEGMRRGEVWRDFQNEYFKEMGLPLRVDPLGAIPQNHVGPVRMRAHRSQAVELNNSLREVNGDLSINPVEIVNHLFKNEAVVSGDDISRYVNKHTSSENRELVLECIYADERLVSLYDRDTSSPVGLYTLSGIRDNEERLVSLAEKILDRKCNISLSRSNKEMALEGTSLSDEQRLAFNKATSLDNFVIMEGVAGSGKSRTLLPIVEAHIESGYRVVGMAPTAAASKVMKEIGVDESKTVKGALLAIEKGYDHLDKNTYVVVDEAAMVDNKQMSSLLYYVNKSKAKLLLVGHDKQLNPVGRGGVFPILMDADRRIELNDIYRQDGWQKDLSNSLVCGEFGRGVGILKDNNAIKYSKGVAESMVSVIGDYCDSYCEGRSATIISHRRVDVMALNNGVRDELRLRGRLSGDDHMVRATNGELALTINDKVMLTQNDRKLGVSNGDLGDVVRISKESVTLKMFNGAEKNIKFADYGGFSHGYAVTAHKMQGKTIDDSFVFINSRIDNSLAYVAMTRQKENLGIYVNSENTKSLDHLVWQISLSGGNDTSLNYSTIQGLVKGKSDGKNTGESLFDSMVGRVKTKVGDFLYRPESLDDFKRYASPSRSGEVSVSKNHIQPRDSNSFVKEIGLKEQEIPRSNFVKRDLYDIASIRNGLKDKSEDLAHSMLSGFKPNESSASELKFKVKDEYAYSVNIDKGVWKEWKSGEGGDMLSLVQRVKGVEFKEALSWSNNYLGGGYDEPSKVVDKIKPIEEKKVEIDAAKQKKIDAAVKNYDYSKSLVGTLGQTYLNEFRGINKCVSDLKDIRFVPNLYRGRNQESLPAVVAFARNESGEITGRQAIFLNPETGAKADIAMAKMSLGQVGKGSVVEIAPGIEGQPTYVAEGLETALSLEEAGMDGRIVCTLGISNISKIPVKDGEKIVICADNDGKDSQTNKTIEDAATILKEKGASVAVVRPTQVGMDFNDVLKEDGVMKLRDHFENIEFTKALKQEKSVGSVGGSDIIKSDTLVGFSESISATIKDMKGGSLTEEYGAYIDKISEKTGEFILNSTGQLECPKDDIARFTNKSHFELDMQKVLSKEFDVEKAERIAAVESRLVLDSATEKQIAFYDEVDSFSSFKNDAIQIVEANMEGSNAEHYSEIYGVEEISKEQEHHLDIYSEKYGVLPTDETFAEMNKAIEFVQETEVEREAHIIEMVGDRENASELVAEILEKQNIDIVSECINVDLEKGEVSEEKMKEIENSVIERGETKFEEVVQEELKVEQELAKEQENMVNSGKNNGMEI